jgi:hypothetical protein
LDEADHACRGGFGNEPSTWRACDERDALMAKITQEVAQAIAKAMAS